MQMFMMALMHEVFMEYMLFVDWPISGSIENGKKKNEKI